MFRELSRKNREISQEECIALLKSETRGVLSVIGDGGYPYGTPMNHYFDEINCNIYFHCGRKGHRLDSLRRDSRVSFCVFDKGFRNEGEWAYNVKSVVVFGRMEIVDDLGEVARITTELSKKFTDDLQYVKEEIERSGKGTLLLKLNIEHMCGKIVNEA